MTNIETIKSIIELSETSEDADHAIEEFTPYRTYEEKYTFLREIFPGYIVLDADSNDRLTDYQALLSCIVNAKWR